MIKAQSRWMNWVKLIFIAVVLVANTSRCDWAAAQPSRFSQSMAAFNPSLAFPTLGGTQYWSDIRVSGGWKIQRNAVFDRFRLIDSGEVRRAVGDLAECEKMLQHNLANGTIKPTKGKVVILLHGLLRTNDTMATLAEYLKKNGGYEVINLAYASSMASIDLHATDLRKVIESLDPEITEINFVAHSMGNIVVRRYLKSIERNPDPRFHRMVMLAPPNQGSEKARNLSRNTRLFEKVAGPSGEELGVGWNQLAPKLATPNFEFGIIIGAKERASEKDNRAEKGPTIPKALSLFEASPMQPHDFTVSVEEAKLAGSRDFVVGPYYHWNIKYHPEAMKQTLYFLQNGRFDHVPPDAFDGPDPRKPLTR